MKNVPIILASCLFSFIGRAQLLMNQEGEAFTEIPFFNVKMIHANRIKSIEGTYSTKKPGEIIRESSDWYRYLFDNKGRLIESLDVRTINRKKDTLLHQYHYDSLNLMDFHRKSENEGFTCVRFQYDSLRRISEQNTYREIYDYRQDNVVQSILLFTEYFEYNAVSSERTQTRLNNYKLPYLDAVSFYNQDGYLVERKTHYRMSSITHTTKFSYNEYGLLSAKAHYNDQDELADEEWKFRYDTFGNLIEAHLYRYGQFQKDLQIIFDTKTQLLGSTIHRDVTTNFWIILRFIKYTYYS